MSTVLGLPVVLIDRGSPRSPDPHRLFAAGGRGEWKAPPEPPSPRSPDPHRLYVAGGRGEAQRRDPWVTRAWLLARPFETRPRARPAARGAREQPRLEGRRGHERLRPRACRLRS